MLSKIFKISIVLLYLLAFSLPSKVGYAADHIPPFASAPACTDANGDGHADVTDNKNFGKFPDKELYHDLWNETVGCHYNHEHGDDPSLGNKYFGEPGALWGGQTIAYPFTSSAMENVLKHDGYKWVVRTPEYHPWHDCANPPTPEVFASDIGQSTFCVKAVRAQLHISAAMDIFTRYHSGFVEVYACRPPYRDPEDCGVFKMGSSLIDWGMPKAPQYKENRLRPFPGYNQPTYTVDFGGGIGGGMVMSGLLTDSINFPDLPNKSGEPYINLEAEQLDLENFRNRIPTTGRIPETWSSNDYDCEPRPPGDPCHNQYFRILYGISDPWFLADLNDLRDVDFICVEGQPCHYNGSLTGLNEAGIKVPAEWDTKDGVADGFATWSGFTDRFGNPREGCTLAGHDCVPFSLVHVPTGHGQVRTKSGCSCATWEHDIYFNGQPSGWIQFNINGHNSHPTTPPPATPTGTPPSSGPFVSTQVDPTSLNPGGTALASVILNNVPVEGYKSAEFTCTYNAGLVEKSNIAATNLFGTDSALAIHDPQNGTFIVAIAGTNGNKAMTGGPAFTFSLKGLQAGQSQVQCTARVSKGDNVPLDLPSVGTSLTVQGIGSPPMESPTSTPGDHQHPTETGTPVESATPAPSPNGTLNGQVVASKPVNVNLIDGNNVVVTSMTANPDGTFSLSALAGNYTVIATASGFLSHQGSVTLTGGNTIVLPAVNLVAGDVDGNNVIDQFDALTVGMSYTTSSPAAADLNSDGVIDFLDLELLANNYRKTGPTVWE